MTERLIRSDLLLAENIRALLAARHVDGAALSMAIGHTPSWLSKIMMGDRKMSVEDAGKVAAYFGLSLAELFSPGISSVTERRKGQRRAAEPRRILFDRRHIAVAFLNSTGIASTYALQTPGVMNVPRPSTALELPRQWEPVTIDDIDRRILAATDFVAKLYELRVSVTSSARPAPPIGKGGTRSTEDHRSTSSDAAQFIRRKARP